MNTDKNKSCNLTIFKFCNLQFCNWERGAAALLTVLMIGGVITGVGLTGLFVAYLLGQSGFGVNLSNQALRAAESGINDGILKVVRNKDYFQSGSYNIAVNNYSASVKICKDFINKCASVAPGKFDVVSLGTALTKKRQLEAVLNVSSLTGEVQIESIEEIPI